jgi:hypothetical protein
MSLLFLLLSVTFLADLFLPQHRGITTLFRGIYLFENVQIFFDGDRVNLERLVGVRIPPPQNHVRLVLVATDVIQRQLK